LLEEGRGVWADVLEADLVGCSPGDARAGGDQDPERPEIRRPRLLNADERHCPAGVRRIRM
jgi:hypothetical protein